MENENFKAYQKESNYKYIEKHPLDFGEQCTFSSSGVFTKGFI